MSKLTEESKEALEKELKELEASLSGNMISDMDIKDKIHNIKMKIQGVRPSDSFIECVGCGS